MGDTIDVAQRADMTQQVRAVFEHARLHRIFEVDESCADALQAFEREP